MLARALVVALGLATCGGACASTRLDDSLSPRQRVDTTTRWLYDGVGDWNIDQINALVAEVHAMQFRLRTDAYVGKNAEIYLTVPLQVTGLRSPTAMRLEWTTRGVFSPGTLVPGNRALVYRGKITAPVMSDYFDFRIFLDARTSERGIEFDPIFEIDLIPQ
jgi:hypothetical protein